MTQVTIDLDEETAKALACAAERDRVSESAWATEAVRKRLDTEDPVGPDDTEARRQAFLALAGSWEDDGRPIEEIMEEIRPSHWTSRDVNLD